MESPVRPDTIYEGFRSTALKLADEPLILAAAGDPVSFGEVLEFVDSTRSILHGMGIGRGARLGSIFSDRAEAAVSHLLSVSTGTAVPIDPNITAPELDSTIRDTKLDALIAGSDVPESLIETALKSSIKVILTRPLCNSVGLFELVDNTCGSPVDASLPEADDISVVLQTSGTTGERKIVPQSQLSRMAMIHRISNAMQIKSGDRCLNMMPMHHTAGLTGELLAPLITGASVAFVDFNPASIVASIGQFSPAWFCLVPSMHTAVISELGDQHRVFHNSSLRFIRSASAKLGVTLRRKLEVTYGLPVLEFYGSSETGIMAFAGRPDEPFPDGSVGKAIHTGVQVQDEHGIPSKPGEKGEICCSGPTVIDAYESNPAANDTSFRDGWYRTGDEGYFDDDGFLFITGRIREVVNRGGEKISLAEIDEILLKQPEVELASAFSAPHDVLGHEIYAAVVLEQGSSESAERLRAEVARQLSWSKVPKRIFIVQELPVNSVGKVVRQRLVEKLVGSS